MMGKIGAGPAVRIRGADNSTLPLDVTFWTYLYIMAEESALALPSIQGWLEVRLRKLPIWRRRYCTLCATQLR